MCRGDIVLLLLSSSTIYNTLLSLFALNRTQTHRLSIFCFVTCFLSILCVKVFQKNGLYSIWLDLMDICTNIRIYHTQSQFHPKGCDKSHVFGELVWSGGCVGLVDKHCFY